MKNRRLMVIEYHNDADVERLKTILRMCCVPFVMFKEFEFIGGGALWKIFIDKGRLTWKQIMETVNDVRPVRFRYRNDCYIENGVLCTETIIIR